MSMTVNGTWKAGAWAPTVWANGVWLERSTVVGRGRVYRVPRGTEEEEKEVVEVTSEIRIVNDLPKPVKTFREAKHKFKTDPNITLQTLDQIFHKETEDLSEKYRKQRRRRKQKRLLLMLLLDEDV